MLTEEQKAYHRESYAWYKARGICTDCGKQYSEPNRVKCADCLEKDRLRSKRRYKNQQYADHSKELAKARYQRLREAGICYTCGKKPVYREYSRCYECYIKNLLGQRRRREASKKYYKEQGLCLRCGGRRAEGFMFCETCLTRCRQSLESGRQTQFEEKRKLQEQG